MSGDLFGDLADAVDNQLSIDDALSELGRVIPSRDTDPETSHAAAKEIRVKAGSQRAKLLRVFAIVGEYGRSLTDEQAMELAADVSPTSEYSKRCSELRDGGFIEPTGETRKGSSGMQRIVSRVTPKGVEWDKANQ